MPAEAIRFDIQSLGEAFRRGTLTPTALVAEVDRRIAAAGADAVWIDRLSADELYAKAAELEALSPIRLPLYGIPFALKDNIDVAGRTTTAGCPAYAYRAAEDAPVVRALLDAGAILVGKTNLDQFATGLVGTRSPYGIPGNSFDPRYIPGGSSSGSAVAVAKGLVSFALGTDTAGSGRVPAAFNNIVGLKPSRGLLSTRGVVPACRSLDCVSIFALTADDAAQVLDVTAVFDARDVFARPTPPAFEVFPVRTPARFRFGLPRVAQREFFGDRSAEAAFDAAVERLQSLGGTAVEIDFEPFLEVARLLYDGPWVEERRAAVGDFITGHPADIDPVVRRIIADAPAKTAVEVYRAYYRLKALRRTIGRLWRTIDLLVTPTAATIYSIRQIQDDPVGLNENLGYYTNFMNLLDLAAVAVPTGFLARGLPFGVTLCAPAFTEARLLAVGDSLHRASGVPLGASDQVLPGKAKSSVSDPDSTRSGERVEIAVVGAHLSGMPLNHQLTDLGGILTRRTRTAARYRLYALPDSQPPKPGLIRSDDGQPIELEVWQLSYEAFGRFVSKVPAPLAIGTIELEDGTEVQGFLCEAYAVEGAPDISAFGGWRAFVGSLST